MIGSIVLTQRSILHDLFTIRGVEYFCFQLYTQCQHRFIVNIAMQTSFFLFLLVGQQSRGSGRLQTGFSHAMMMQLSYLPNRTSMVLNCPKWPTIWEILGGHEDRHLCNSGVQMKKSTFFLSEKYPLPKSKPCYWPDNES